MTLPRILRFFCLQAVPLLAFSQRQNLKFEHLGTDDGLSQSNAMSILQDGRGYRWFATQDGLNKYNGYQFTVYKNNAQNPKSLGNN